MIEGLINWRVGAEASWMRGRKLEQNMVSSQRNGIGKMAMVQTELQDTDILSWLSVFLGYYIL